jgi:CRISPR-associated protein Cas2
MMYLVSYDISDARARRRVSEVLDDFGIRIHESLFECLWGPADDVRVRDRLVDAMEEKSGALRIYRLVGQGARVFEYGESRDFPTRWQIW